MLDILRGRSMHQGALTGFLSWAEIMSVIRRRQFAEPVRSSRTSIA